VRQYYINSFLMAPAHPGDPEKKGRKTIVVVLY